MRFGNADLETMSKYICKGHYSDYEEKYFDVIKDTATIKQEVENIKNGKKTTDVF